MWGLFRKRESEQRAESLLNDERERFDTEPIEREDEPTDAPVTSNAEDEIASPSEWLEQARAARAAERARTAPERDDALKSTPVPETVPAASAPEPITDETLDPDADALVAATRARWQAELDLVGGLSPLRSFRGERGTVIDLSVAHPSGIAPLLAGRPVMLSDLLREPIAFRTGRDAADLIARKSIELEAARGIDPVHIAMGIASWEGERGRRVDAPILLRSAAIRRLGRDYEVRLRGGVRVNGALLRELYADGVTLRASELLDLVDADTFLPDAVFTKVREVASHLPEFEIDPRAMLSSFVDVAGPLAADARSSSGTNFVHPLLDALAGDPRARAKLARQRRTANAESPDRRDPANERLLLDADTDQERVIDEIVAGNSFVVEALPGTGLTQTVVNAIGRLVDLDRRVLVVAPRSARVRSIRARLKQLGLEGLAVTPRTMRRDLIAAITRNERAEKAGSADIDQGLVSLRRVLADYRAALLEPSPRYGASALDALEALSRLEFGDRPPSTTARLEPETLERFSNADAREDTAARLAELGQLGQFRFGPDDSPWYGVSFDSTDEVAQVRETAEELAKGAPAAFVGEVETLLAQTRLAPPESFAQIGLYLRLLADIRETLDRFLPDVFDANLGELIEATGASRRNNEIPAAKRRELRALAREYTRPGVTINDLHESLKWVQRQRVLWQRYVVDGALPTVPTGIEAARAKFQELDAKLRIVDQPLIDAGSPSLVSGPLEQLQPRLEALAGDTVTLETVLERLAISEQLRAEGLGPLLDDLTLRRLEPEEAADELELAWWQSVLEALLSEQPALLNAKTSLLARLDADFREVDAAHPRASARQLAWQLAQAWKVALVDDADESDALKALLRSPGAGSGRLTKEARRLSRPLTRVWVATPYDVPMLSDALKFDTVIITDAAALSTVEALAALRRADQVVAFGDPITQFPTRFQTAIDPPRTPQREESPEAVRELDDDSLFARLAEFLPQRTLTHSYRAGGEDLTELVNERFYGGRLTSMPWAGSFLGHSSLTYSYVEGGTGMPDPETGTVEATDAEVTRVVELVIDHALRRPRESLMVVTASAKHARRVEQAVWSAVSARPDIAAAFTNRRLEPFIVTTIDASAAQSRDRVIFSLGYGITPHGRVLSDFGVLAGPRGERMLAVAMTRARGSLVIVSCIRPEQLDPARLTPGTIALAQILSELEERTERPGSAHGVLDESGSTLLVDLGRRLSSYGMRVELDYRGQIPLAASYGGRAIAVDLDAATGPEVTLREALRLRPQLLKRLGWYYLRVHAFELFAEPEAVAQRIAKALSVPIPTEPIGDQQEIEAARRSITTRPSAPKQIEAVTVAEAVAVEAEGNIRDRALNEAADEVESED